MFSFPLKLILSLTTLSLLLVAAAFANNSGRAEPTLTSSNSVLPHSRTFVLYRRSPSRPPFHPLEL